MGVLRPLHAPAAGEEPRFHTHESSELRARSGPLDPAFHAEEYADSPQLRAQVAADAPHLRIFDAIGEGGMSVVFAGTHLTLDMPVAIKVLRAKGPQRDEMAARLLFEGKLCAALSEAGAPRVLDARRLADGTPYLVMERIGGRVLADLLDQGPLEPGLALDIADGLLHTLAAVHAEGVVHRDVKPANIIVEPRGASSFRVRLIDFGVATQSGVRTKPLNMGESFATQTGTVVGTPDYMAPEQLLGRAVDARADVYAAATTLFHMLAGAPPFHRGAMHLSIAATLRDPLPQLSQLRPGLPLLLEQVVAAALSRDPDARTPSAEALRMGLRSVAMGQADPFAEIPGESTLSRTYPIPGEGTRGRGAMPIPGEGTRGRSAMPIPGEGTRGRGAMPAPGWPVAAPVATPVPPPAHVPSAAPLLRIAAEDTDATDDLALLFPRRRGRARGALMAVAIVGLAGAAAYVQRTPRERMPQPLAEVVDRASGAWSVLSARLAGERSGEDAPVLAPADQLAPAPALEAPAAAAYPAAHAADPAPSAAAALDQPEASPEDPSGEAELPPLQRPAALAPTSEVPSSAAGAATGARSQPLVAAPDGSFQLPEPPGELAAPPPPASPWLDTRPAASSGPERRRHRRGGSAVRSDAPAPVDEHPVVGDGFPLDAVIQGIDDQLRGARSTTPASEPSSPLQDNPY
jgi:tRNA A-37 threonylcarbamoyl transferase component Bud32